MKTELKKKKHQIERRLRSAHGAAAAFQLERQMKDDKESPPIIRPSLALLIHRG